MPLGTAAVLGIVGGSGLILALLAGGKEAKPDDKTKEEKEKEAEEEAKKGNYGPFTDASCTALKSGAQASMWHDDVLVPAIDAHLIEYDKPIVSLGAFANLVQQALNDSLQGSLCKPKDDVMFKRLYKDAWCTTAYYLAGRGLVDEEPEDIAKACADETYDPTEHKKLPVEAETLTPGKTLVRSGYDYRLRLPYRTPETVVLMHEPSNGGWKKTEKIIGKGWAQDDDKEYVVRVPVKGTFKAQAMDKAGQEDPYKGVFIAEYIIEAE